MRLTRERMLEGMRARDERLDGRFIIGVLSTGIFCLPSCKARKPNPENVRFFASPRQAREAGLRPCKRCRPEDYYLGRDPEMELVSRLVERMAEDPGDFEGVDDMAGDADVGTSKLYDLFRRYYHATPAAMLTRLRLERAARLLLSGRERIVDIAFQCGFQTLSAFNDRFRRKNRMSPSAYRRMADGGEFALELPAGYPWRFIFNFLGRDPESPSERVEGRWLKRACRVREEPCSYELKVQGDRIRCRAAGAPGRTPPAADVHRRILHELALDQDPRPFESRMAAEPALRGLVGGRRGLRIPLMADPVEALIWVVVGQQVNLPFAFALRREVFRLAGTPLGGDGLAAPPRARDLADLDASRLRGLRFSRQKADYLIRAGKALEKASWAAPPTLDPAPLLEKRLLAIKGLGPWSVHYLLMRCYGFQDCVPVGDAGLVRGLQRYFGLEERPGPGQTTELMERFRPHRSLATFHLWHLETKL